MHNTKTHCQHLFCNKQMANISSGITSAYRAITLRIYRLHVILILSVLKVDCALPSEQTGVSCVSGRHHTIEEVNATGNRLNNICRSTQRYHEKRRGSARISDAKVLTRNNCVKAKGTAKFRFLSNGRQELVLVTEPNGMVNMKVYDCMNNIWHNDDDALDTGKPHHVRIFDIPGGNTQIEVEVINKTDKDVSFVVITNR